MFNFMSMAFNYESRKVDRYSDDNGLFVDTCEVTDSDQPYETGISHPEYNSGALIIVEMYPTAEEAKAGHDRWVAIMTTEPLPKMLTDVSTCALANLIRDMKPTSMRFERNKV